MAMADEGATLIATARRAGALEELDDTIKARTGRNTTLIPLDLAKMDRIDSLGPALLERFGRLDVLVANAGMLGLLSPLGHIQANVWQQVMDVNLNANWRLIRILDPLLKRSDAGRAVFVTSGAARGDKAYWGPYAVSKAGLEALVNTYAAELENEPVNVNLLNPGPLRTAMREKAFPGEDPAALPKPEDLVEAFIALATPDCRWNGRLLDGRTFLKTRDVAKSLVSR